MTSIDKGSIKIISNTTNTFSVIQICYGIKKVYLFVSKLKVKSSIRAKNAL